MKKNILIILIIFLSCNEDDRIYREELPGVKTIIKGNVKDCYRQNPVKNYKIRLYDYP